MAGKTRIGPLARVTDYAKNVGKEYNEWKYSNSTGPSPEDGQFWGAVLKGYRYDDKGRRK